MVIQGDNTGPHNEAAYINYVKSHCGFEWYYWEPQAPQMPHLNVLDLSFFCYVKKTYSSFLRMGWTALHVLKQNEIWDYSKDAWNNLPNYNIAYIFVSAFNIEGEFLN